MKTKNIQNLDNYSGTLLIPVFETYENNLVPIEFHGVTVSSKVFYGKKDSLYLVEKYDCTHVFIGLGKTIDYKSLKIIFRRIASKHAAIFKKNTALVLPELFSNDQIEATISGLLLGTYNLGHFKKKEQHLLLNDDFELDILSQKDTSEILNKGIKIAYAQLEVLHMVDLPPNTVTPKYLSNWATTSGSKYGFTTEIFGTSVSFHLNSLSLLILK